MLACNSPCGHAALQPNRDEHRHTPRAPAMDEPHGASADAGPSALLTPRQPLRELPSMQAVKSTNVEAAGRKSCVPFTQRRRSADATNPADSHAVELRAAIVATINQLDEEHWLPVRGIVTMFRIQVSGGGRGNWHVLRRYSDFSTLHCLLSKTFGNRLPQLPPKLLRNADEHIAQRYLELDAYLRALLNLDRVRCCAALLHFLGASKQVICYGVRHFQYDSLHSEGNRYIRDEDL